MSNTNFSFSVIIGRFKEASGAFSDGEVAALLGFKHSAFSQRKKQESIPFEEIIRYARDKGISTDWLFFGQGTAQSDETPEEKEYLGKCITALRNPATSDTIKSTLHTLIKVPPPGLDGDS